MFNTSILYPFTTSFNEIRLGICGITAIDDE
jgi:hypothetical protein